MVLIGTLIWLLHFILTLIIILLIFQDTVSEFTGQKEQLSGTPQLQPDTTSKLTYVTVD